jgi:hypothetical protein
MKQFPENCLKLRNINIFHSDAKDVGCLSSFRVIATEFTAMDK